MAIVALVAVVVSQGAAVFAFTWERGESMRRLVSTQVGRQILGLVTDALARSSDALGNRLPSGQGFGQRYWISAAPSASAVSQLSGPAQELVDTIRAGLPEQIELRAEEGPPRPFPRNRPPSPPPQNGAENNAGARPETNPPPDGLGKRGPPGPWGGIGRPESVRFTTISVRHPDGVWLNAEVGVPQSPSIPREPLLIVLITGLIAALATGLAAAQIGKPLRRLAASAEQFGRGEGFVPAPETGPKDIRQAATSFNAMAASLQSQLDRQRRTLWALSHDLRTPLTALRIQSEMIDDPTTRQSMQRPIQAMERLTEDALALARAGAKTSPLEVVDLAELVTDASRGDGADDNTNGLSLEFDIERPVWYPCRPGEMFRAVQNLAMNARRHAGGGAITLKQEANGSVTITIADNGPGVPEDIINRLTEPFFRGDTARSTEGSGLGLAIARACVEAHEGTLELSNRLAGTGLIATIQLPAAPPSRRLEQPV